MKRASPHCSAAERIRRHPFYGKRSTGLPVCGLPRERQDTFIQETFEDPNFDSGDKTLLLVCEEGEVEYKPEKFAFPGTSIRVLEDKSELNAQNLANLEKETGAGRVIIEYNGMWLLQDLADALPPALADLPGDRHRRRHHRFDLRPGQRHARPDAGQDRPQRADRVQPGRKGEQRRGSAGAAPPGAAGVRRCDIAYEFADGSVAYDDIPDPLPFDVDAPVIEIGDDDFGIWYLDCQEDPQKYVGKTVRFLAQVCQTSRAGKNSFVPGPLCHDLLRAGTSSSWASPASTTATRPWSSAAG